MKYITTIILFVLTFIVSTPKSNAGWFSDGEDQQKINKLENQLQEQQHNAGSWQIIAFTLGTGCVALLVVGTAIGSKARRDAKSN